MNVEKFVNSLTTPQIRALACQNGVKGWKTEAPNKLRDTLLSMDRVKALAESYDK